MRRVRYLSCLLSIESQAEEELLYASQQLSLRGFVGGGGSRPPEHQRHFQALLNSGVAQIREVVSGHTN